MTGDGPDRTSLPVPEWDEATTWVQRHLGHLTDDAPARSRFRGGQRAADAALAALDVTGYARRRNEVLPVERRGATAVSPYVRHGLLPLRELWDHVADAPERDRDKYRDELLWQEYARHLYARVGVDLGDGLRRRLDARPDAPADPWAGELACVRAAVDELEADGWLVNQARMWLASHWAVRGGTDWRAGEERFFRHLVDGSRAANRAGWQWTIGTATGKPYGFSRWQVQRRAPGCCDACALRDRCPIEDWPDDPPLGSPPESSVGGDGAATLRTGDAGVDGGPSEPVTTDDGAEWVWLTAESLGDADPALGARPDLPVVFVWDEPLLRRLRLSSKRLVFLAECLAELAERRVVELHLGDPGVVLAGRRLATTFAPVPGHARLRARLAIAELHPWPWLVRPGGGSVSSFSAWRRAVRAPATGRPPRTRRRRR